MEENREELRRKIYEMLKGKALDLIYGPDADIKEKYGREPGREVMIFFVNLVEQNKIDKEKEELLYS